ncbi:hypothetical protein A2635_04440 [Candidatus Peribacteria bacterium RIFCSPHIGHO2_01_FULL_51_9]|nr:MAG: hypothetical protein A2635_04440 [Candidatus Peribacteria bacterium RIFCSPHIGHO2_01_FULL_51_9]
MDPIKIPQNVYVEDRIIGPVTLRQIIICLIGGGFSYALFASLQKMYGSVGLPLAALVWTPGILAAAFAFVKVNDLSLFHLCTLFLERMSKPMTRAWSPRRGIVINFQIHAPKEAEGPTVEKHAEHKNGLEKLSTILDAGDTTEHEEDGLSRKPIEQKPIDRSKIKAEPLTEEHSIDQIQREEESSPATIHPSVSLFRDILPPKAL